jgi:hypothetical protein
MPISDDTDPAPRPTSERRPCPIRWRDRAVDALLALGVGLLTGLLAHKFAGDEPLASDPEYAGHLFAELLIVALAALITYWLLDDIRSSRRRPAE